VALQELQAWNAAIFLEHPVLRRTYRHSLAALAQTTPSWTAVLARWPIVNRQSVPGIGGWRGLQLLVLNVSGLVLTASSAHFTAADCEVKESLDRLVADYRAHPLQLSASSQVEGRQCPAGDARAEDLRAAFAAADRYGGRESLLMGDFNFGSQPEFFGTEQRELQRHPEWRDAWDEANGTQGESGFTWHNRRNPINKLATRAGAYSLPSSRVDRVLVRGGLRPTSAALVNDRPLPCAPQPRSAARQGCAPIYVSDHFGVAVQLEAGSG